MQVSALIPRLAGNGTVEPTHAGSKLTVPAGNDKTYRLAQLDDYGGRARGSLPWRHGSTMRLRARVSGTNLPGTWGFGFWNNPFGAACGPTGENKRLPALPQAAWFFGASPRSYLSLRDHGPANGFFAQVFRSPRVGIWLVQAALVLPFSISAVRRRLALSLQDETAGPGVDVRDWHTYEIKWNDASTVFAVDQHTILSTGLSPRGPLGFLVWIDNQFAGFDPRGRPAWGLEARATESWLEFADLTCTSSSSSSDA